MNAINIIKPYKWDGIWAFDDEDKGLKAEPLVEGADTLLDLVTDGEDVCKIMFASGPFPSHQFVVELNGPNIVAGEEYGHFYFSPSHEHDLWLCPALLKYFNEAPDKIYIKIF